jgi:hypothetical protein
MDPDNGNVWPLLPLSASSQFTQMLGSTDWLPGGGMFRGWFRSPARPFALDASQAARIDALLKMKAEAGLEGAADGSLSHLSDGNRPLNQS